MAEELEPHIVENYKIVQRLGKGAYGVVWRAVDNKTNEQVAIKKVFDAFHNSTDAQRTFREVMFLKELRGHENVVRLFDLIPATNPNDLYLVFEFMESDLHAVIRGQILLDIHKKYVIYQILRGMKFIHTGEIIHRDLKPSNVLLNSDCLAKIADFGLARSVVNEEEEDPQAKTEYIATRWYRAPEIVLGSQRYTKAIDMWSVGCILAEMLTGKALFPGKSTPNQIQLIIELLGFPSQEDIDSLDSKIAAEFLSQVEKKAKPTFNKVFASACPEAQDLLRKLLTFNPKKRITAEDALNHPYVKEFHYPVDEPICKRPVHIPIDDNIKLSRHEYREALHKFIKDMKQKAQLEKSKEKVIRRQPSKDQFVPQKQSQQKPSHAPQEAESNIWRQVRYSQSKQKEHPTNQSAMHNSSVDNLNNSRSNFSSQYKQNDLRKSGSKSILESHSYSQKYGQENYKVLNERQKDYQQVGHKEYLENKYRNRVLTKQSSKSRLNDSALDEKNYMSRSKMDEYEIQKKQTHTDKENHYYKFLKKLTNSQANPPNQTQTQNSYPSQQQPQSYSKPMQKEIITMQNPIQSITNTQTSNQSTQNRLSRSRQSIDSKINQYGMDQYKRSGSRNGMKDSRAEEETGPMGSKFLYNVILNNSKSKGKLAAYRSRKDLLN